jgi:hypothetical protein
MSQFNFSLLANNEHIVAFNRITDVLNFDSLAISASAVTVTQVDSNLSFSYGGKTVWLDNLLLENLILTDTSSTITFANGSGMGFGDWASSPIHDWEGVYYDLTWATDGRAGRK